MPTTTTPYGQQGSNPFLYPWDPGGAWDTSAQQPAAPSTPPDTSARDKLIAQLAADHKGQQGGASAVYNKPTAAQTAAAKTDEQKKQLKDDMDSGFDLYTFGDGTTIELSQNGQSRNQKIPTSATKTPTTPQEQLLASGGPMIIGTGADAVVYQANGKNPDGTTHYEQTTASAARQAMDDAKLKAETAVQQNTAVKGQLDNLLAADPTNIALQQQQKQAELALSQAQRDASAAATAKSQFDTDALAKKLPGEIAQQGATLAGTEATTDATKATTAGTEATTDRTKQLTPIDVQTAQVKLNQAILDLQNSPNDTATKNAFTKAQTEYQDAMTKSVTAKANEPTLLATGTTAPTNTFWNPVTGKLEDRPNAAYTPTDPGRMTVQLQQQAKAQFDQLQQQVTAGKITSDQADSQFSKYLQDNIDPVKQDIAAAQAKAQGALDQTAAQTQYYQAQAANLPATLAQTGSSDAQRNLISMMPYVVGASAATTPGITTGKGGFPQINSQQIMQNATYSLPNLQEVGRQGAAAALAHLSPTAQQHLQTPGPPGQPPVPGVPSPQDLLNRTAYGSFGPPPGAGGGGGGAAGAAPGSNYNPNDIQWNQQANPASQPGRVVGPGGVIFNAQGQPEGTPPGMTPGLNNGAYQPLYPQAPAAGMPATGPVAGLGGLTPQQAGAAGMGAGMGDLAGWGAGYGLNLNNLMQWPPYQPSS